MLKVEEWAVNNIHEYGNNAKIHTEEQVWQIAKSIELFGNCDPILIDEYGEIIAGHGRFKALKMLHKPTAEVIVLRGLTSAQKKALRLAHNQINQNTGFDVVLLDQELEFLQQDFPELSDFGFILPVDIDEIDFEPREEPGKVEGEPEEEERLEIYCPHCKRRFNAYDVLDSNGEPIRPPGAIEDEDEQ